ncbi:MAG: hypothetical protein JSV93_05650, partial [Candidatus Omnitrophota bacterium]
RNRDSVREFQVIFKEKMLEAAKQGKLEIGQPLMQYMENVSKIEQISQKRELLIRALPRMKEPLQKDVLLGLENIESKLESLKAKLYSKDKPEDILKQIESLVSDEVGAKLMMAQTISPDFANIVSQSGKGKSDQELYEIAKSDYMSIQPDTEQSSAETSSPKVPPVGKVAEKLKNLKARIPIIGISKKRKAAKPGSEEAAKKDDEMKPPDVVETPPVGVLFTIVTAIAVGLRDPGILRAMFTVVGSLDPGIVISIIAIPLGLIIASKIVSALPGEKISAVMNNAGQLLGDLVTRGKANISALSAKAKSAARSKFDNLAEAEKYKILAPATAKEGYVIKDGQKIPIEEYATGKDKTPAPSKFDTDIIYRGHPIEGEIIGETDETIIVKQIFGGGSFAISTYKKSDIERIGKSRPEALVEKQAMLEELVPQFAPGVAPKGLETPLLGAQAKITAGRTISDFEVNLLGTLDSAKASEQRMQSMLSYLEKQAGLLRGIYALAFDATTVDESVRKLAETKAKFVQVVIIGKEIPGIKNAIYVPREGEGTLSQRIEKAVGDRHEGKSVAKVAIALREKATENLEREIRTDINTRKDDILNVPSYALINQYINNNAQLNMANLLHSVLRKEPCFIAIGYDNRGAFASIRNLLNKIGGFFMVIEKVSEDLQEIFNAIKETITSM